MDNLSKWETKFSQNYSVNDLFIIFKYASSNSHIYITKYVKFTIGMHICNTCLNL